MVLLPGEFYHRSAIRAPQAENCRDARKDRFAGCAYPGKHDFKVDFWRAVTRLEQVSTCGPNFAVSQNWPFRSDPCWGVPSPNPAFISRMGASAAMDEAKNDEDEEYHEEE